MFGQTPIQAVSKSSRTPAETEWAVAQVVVTEVMSAVIQVVLVARLAAKLVNKRRPASSSAPQ